MGVFQQFANIRDWTWPQYQAAGKHALSFAAGATAAAAALHFITPQDAASITENLNTIWDGIMQVAKGMAGLAAVLVPIYTALRAAHNASPSEQVKHVEDIAKDPAQPSSDAAKEALTAATASIPGRMVLKLDPGTSGPKTEMALQAVAQIPSVEQVVTTVALANATPNPKVVSSPVVAPVA